MTSNKFTPFHTHQMIIYVLIFIILLIASAWMYQTSFVERVSESEYTPATKEDIELIYGQTVEIHEDQKATIESIYGNQ